MQHVLFSSNLEQRFELWSLASGYNRGCNLIYIGFCSMLYGMLLSMSQRKCVFVCGWIAFYMFACCWCFVVESSVATYSVWLKWFYINSRHFLQHQFNHFEWKIHCLYSSTFNVLFHLNIGHNFFLVSVCVSSLRADGCFFHICLCRWTTLKMQEHIE